MSITFLKKQLFAQRWADGGTMWTHDYSAMTEYALGRGRCRRHSQRFQGHSLQQRIILTARTGPVFDTGVESAGGNHSEASVHLIGRCRLVRSSRSIIVEEFCEQVARFGGGGVTIGVAGLLFPLTNLSQDKF